ncbi:MAG: hypothetical protein HOJ35_12460 [Bdellovibrionales bacterium]|nr:hypothetical protein [Bdellovibrionales bacterium]
MKLFKILSIFFILFFNYQLVAEGCSKDPLNLEEIKRLFTSGSLESREFVKFKVYKKVWRCNEFSDCIEPYSNKTTLKFHEVPSSITKDEVITPLPLYGNAHFKVNLDGTVKLILSWGNLGIFAEPHFDLVSGKVKLLSNQYFRPAQGYINPSLYTSYYNEQRKVKVSFKGHLGNNCLKLTSEMKVPGIGIMYDKYEITFFGRF